jgi:hypothetical protein
MLRENERSQNPERTYSAPRVSRVRPACGSCERGEAPTRDDHCRTGMLAEGGQCLAGYREED